ncbi:sterol desaturase family protein [Marivirga arenosa]|uniref:Sterol desaturase family protein n=1 Tax=Marivirga arenosa TaxID=3059076 RepID=A0AA51RCT5_9BACT|nr:MULTISPECIES: sterol desaturase family protein [unclassified Marivirga]WMN06155.1 sterol desaturase family protein [Marivirga sp. ABR2-2]WNB17516.1 sterol desaturase family protein [Marivirga sp. BKB1-2]
MEYIDIFITSFKDYARYVGNEVINPHWGNYLYWLIGISLFFYALELIMPWRKNQPKIRKDFWLDAFYMFFNFFLFSLVGYYAVSNVFVELFNDFLALFGIENLVAIEINTWPVWAQLLTLFLVRDFIHWNVHRLLHAVPALWEFHKVHHSVEQMGFAAHLRFHWMETIVYRTIEYIPLAMIGFGIQEFLLVHLFALAIGHFNHSNIKVPLGPLKYIFNNPQMHIWHHAKHIPSKTGVNFGISLSIWDYIFGTHYIPKEGRDEPLGFDGMDKFPENLKDQLIYGLKPHKENSK